MPASLQNLPIQLACRLVFDSVSYSNPLPPWFDWVEVGIDSKTGLIAQRIREYLDGRSPAAPFEIFVPKKNGAKKRWLIPSVVDQIVLQAAACKIARPVNAQIDAEKVFSYRYNHDPNRLQFTESQVSSWIQFQDETQRRLQPGGKSMLQFDLQAAFQSIPRPAFFAFLAKASAGGMEIDILRRLLDSYSGPADGLPLINDTVFFLGNAYFGVVDEIVRRHAPEFIRFVDDYRVFGESDAILGKAFENINRELLDIGFKVNMSKLKLGSGRDYLEAIGAAGFAKTDDYHEYTSAAIFSDVVAPAALVALVAKVISNPEEHMNEGLGRLLLGAIRRLRLNAAVASECNYPQSPATQFNDELGGRGQICAAAAKLLLTYAADGNEDWRAVWIAYVFSDHLSDKTRQAVIGLNSVSSLVRIWTQWRNDDYLGDKITIEDMGYLEQGMKGMKHHG